MRQIELEKIRLERAKAELEMAKLKNEHEPVLSYEKHTKAFSFETLVQSMRKKILKLQSRAGGWSLFFSFVERVFTAQSIPNKYKTKINLNLLGEKPSNIIAYLKEIGDYEKVK